ncbi:hypothetical protein TAMA11512_21370 [Selenomonas sp. TAMA-11512]|uniref:phage nozzle protein n=1 Tax=Selenomonas sp. TAMA-11512 TaxID=3095337 RepID=UPI003088B7F1|nr:hypothetical protein TAMA11512_21370 [Selenomonas sp. TAMA-11512]
MGTAYYMQPSFAGGKFDPKVWGRIDNERYASGLRECKNFFIHKFGSVSNRTGFLYLGDAKVSDKKCRLLPFVYSDDQAYVMEFGHLYVRFWNSDGSRVLGENNDPVELDTPYTSDMLNSLRFVQSADTIFIACREVPPRVLTRDTVSSWSIMPYGYKRGPFISQNLDEASTITPSGTEGTITLTASKSIFLEGHVGSVWRLDQHMSGGSVSGSGSAAFTTDTLPCGASGTWRFVTHGASWAGTAVVERSYDNGTTWMQLRSFTHKDAEVNFNVYAEEGEQCLLRARLDAITSGACSMELSVDPYVNVGYVAITAVTDGMTATASVDKDKPICNTSKTDMWFEAAWSGAQGYPSAVCFYEDRLCFAGTKGSPRGVWMSKPADYYNFETSSPTSEDDDSIQIVLTSRKMSVIHTLVAMRQSLIAFSEDGVNTISYSGSSLTPTSISQRAESYYGARNLDILTVGAQCIYVQETGGAVRDIGYDYVHDAYSGNEISLFSSCLINDKIPVEMSYQLEPDSIIWLVREDGALLSCTYMPEQKMVAWAEHETDGEFESVCCIPYDNATRIWAAVKRTVNGSTVRYIERMSKRLPTTDPADQLYMDAASVSDTGSTVSSISCPQLAGRTVGVVVDGNILPDAEVPEDGTLQLLRSGKKVAVGLKYVSKLETMNIEMQGMVFRGVMQGHKVKIGEVILRLLNSRGGKAGQTEEYLDEWQRRSKTDYLGEKLALYTGDVFINGNFSCEEGGRVIVVQDTPMPLTILGILMGLTVSDD